MDVIFLIDMLSTINNIIRKLNIKVLAALMLSLFVLICLPAYANVEGRWIHYPSADMYSYTGSSYGYNHSLKIMDGERYCYFWVTSLPHLYKSKYNSGTEAMIYRVDKSLPEGEQVMEWLYDVLPVSGRLVSRADYCPAGGYLAMVYQDGVIDILREDSGEVMTCTAIRDFIYPADKSVNNITPDLSGRHLYVATAFGYMVIDTQTGRLSEFKRLNTNIDYACQVGGRIVVVSDGLAYAFPQDDVPSDLSSIEPIKVISGFASDKYLNADGSLYSPNSIVPLSDDTFLYLTHAKGKETTGPYVNVATFDGDNVMIVNVSEDLLDYNKYGYGSAGRYDNLNEGILTSSARGYIVNTNARIVEISRGGDIDRESKDPASDFMSRYVVKRDKRNFGKLPVGTEENSLALGSYDGEHYRMYYPLQGYRERSVSGVGAGTVWSAAGEAIMPNASNAFRASYIVYDPTYGMLLRNNSFDTFYDLNANHADALCGYRDGVWRYYGLAGTNYSRRQINPVPRGIGVDPLDSKYIWSGSTEFGLTRINLEDPTDILRMTRSNMSGVGTAGCYAVHNSSKGWANLSCFSVPVFDEHGTMWTLFCDWDNTGIGGVYSLWYLTSDERKASENASRDASVFIMPHRIEIPIDGITTRSRIWPMSHERNKNLLGITAGHYFYSAILDHNGTLDDTTDDKVVYLNHIYNSLDNELSLLRGVYMFEDPYDGALLISYGDGLLVTTREQLFDVDVKRGEILEVESDLSGMLGHPIAQCEVSGIVVDGLGRKWIATMGDGLFCISEDRKTLLAHIVSEDGGLPSNVCVSLAYNPETRSLWIGTDKGIVEYVPAGASLPSNVRREVHVVPAVIEPDYRGYVIIEGLVDAEQYELRSSDGDSVIRCRARSGKVSLHSSELLPGEYGVYEGDNRVATIFRH